MEFRSTNDRFVHYQGDIVSNVSSGGVGNSSHGVQLTGGSTGGIVIAAGDESNIALNVRAKGTGPLNLGQSGAVNIATSSGSTLSLGGGSTGQVTLGSSGSTVFIAGSTAPFSGFLRFEDTAVSTPAVFNDTTCGRVAETTHAIAALSSLTAGTLPSIYLTAYGQNLPAGITVGQAWLGSTTGDVHTRLVKGTTTAIAATTCTIEFVAVRM